MHVVPTAPASASTSACTRTSPGLIAACENVYRYSVTGVPDFRMVVTTFVRPKPCRLNRNGRQARHRGTSVASGVTMDETEVAIGHRDARASATTQQRTTTDSL